MKQLSDIKIGQKVTVLKVNGNGALKRRIMDMGVTKGTEVFITKTAPLGDPLEINVRGYKLTIRKDDAKTILVKETD